MKPRRQPASLPQPRSNLPIYLALLAGTWAVFGQLRAFELVDFDDLAYVTAEPHITDGLTRDSVVWAFTQAHEGYWSPLTWISYMADIQVFGLRSGPLHVTNVVIHAASACLLFAVLKRMTRARWPSACVAALFAIHPLHVESVAWVAERKDVLSTFFWFLTIWSYVRYIEQPRATRYALVIVTFGCGLMAKPMIVTLPVVLLLLDWWPLGRMHTPDTTLEKIPLLLMSLAASVVTVVVQRSAGAVASFDVVSPLTRFENALVSYALYLVWMIWPSGLAAIYPYPMAVPAWQAVAAALAIAAISLFVWRERHRPYLLVGWLWYLVTLLPVIGFIQAGPQARADRYTYVSMIGIAMMAVWTVAEAVRDSPAIKRTAAAAASVAIVFYGALAWRQVQYWRDTETLFRRAIAVTTDNYVAHQGLGTALRHTGRVDEAIAEFREAIRLHPRYAEALDNLGEALLAEKRPADALPNLTEAIRLNPNDAGFHLNRGSVLNMLGKTDEAEAEYRAVLRLAPDTTTAHYALGSLFARQGRMDEAIGAFATVVRLQPDDVKAHNDLGSALASTGRIDEAIAQFSKAVKLRPDLPDVRNNLDRALALRQKQ